MKCGVFLFATDGFMCYNDKVSTVAGQVRALLVSRTSM